MKMTKRLLLSAAIVGGSLFSAQAQDADGHHLTDLWKQYREAADADRPQKEAEILTKIKTEAAARRLPVDFYDAATKYVQSVTRRNWKEREKCRAALAEEVKAFDEPIVTFLWMADYGGSSKTALYNYVKEHPDGFKGRHEAFYTRQLGSHLGGALPEFIADDREYALWRLFDGTKTGLVYPDLAEAVKGRYPNECALEYAVIPHDKTRAKVLDALVEKYSGQAASFYPLQDRLRIEFNELNEAGKKNSSAQYKAFYDRLKQYEKQRQAFTGAEKRIAAGATGIVGLCNTLTGKNLSVSFDKGRAQVSFRNLGSATLTLREEGKGVALRSWTVKNPTGSFYYRDTVSVEVPSLRDGGFVFEVKNGKIAAETSYAQYTLSLAARRDAEGWGVYVADYKSGQPFTQSAVVHVNKNGKETASAEVKLQRGFTLLPESLQKAIASGNSYKDLWVSSGDRRSHEISVWPQDYREDTDEKVTPAMRIFRDQGAYHPGDTLRFQGLLYEGAPEKGWKVLAGRSVKATLLDSESNEIAAQSLRSNVFGTVSGTFAIPKGLRGGHFSLRLEAGKDLRAWESFRVDEFVLPSFTLEWDRSDKLYLVGDEVPVAGTLKSYSGHPLDGARVSLSFSRWGSVVEEAEVPLKEGRFDYAFHAKETGYFTVTARVTDPTGETLDFTSWVCVNDQIRLSADVRQTLEGEFRLKNEPTHIYRYGFRNYPEKRLVAGETLEVAVSTENSEGQTVKDFELGYSLYDITARDTVEIRSGRARSGETLSLPLGKDCALYLLTLSGEQKNGLGETVKATRVYHILRLADGKLPSKVDYVFAQRAERPAGKVCFGIGANDGPQWTVVSIHDRKLRPLHGEVLRTDKGAFKWMEIAAKAAWPEAMHVNLFAFKSSGQREYEFHVVVPKQKEAFPLTLSRFEDRALPGTEYRLTLQTSPDAEVLVAAWDKSLDAIAANPWYKVNLRESYLPSVNVYAASGYVSGSRGWDDDDVFAEDLEEVLDEYDAAGQNETVVVGYGRTRAVRMKASANVALAAVPEAEEAEEADAGGAADEPALRSDFATALTFQPHLRPGADGTLEVSFRTSDKLSTYWLGVFAHDQKMNNEVLQKEILVTLPVKVSLLDPRYLYAGDRYEAAVTVSSNADVPLSGKVRFVSTFRASGVGAEPMTAAVEALVTLEPKGSATLRFPVEGLEVRPAFSGDHGSLELTATFVADGFSDGLRLELPVYPAAQTLTEAHSAVLHGGADREALLRELLGRFVNVPGSAATLRDISILDMVKEAIPTKVDPAGNDVLSLSEAWYVRLLSGKLLDQAFETSELLDKILACRNADGGFAWFEGMQSSPMITAVVLERMAKIAEKGFDVPDMAETVKYLDRQQFSSIGPVWRCGISDAQYMYVRSFYPEVAFGWTPNGKVEEKGFAEFKKDAADYLTPAKKRGLNGQIIAKARRLLTLRRLAASAEGKALAKAWGVTPSKLSGSIAADVRSLSEYAVDHRDGGMYFPNAVMPWRGLLESEAYAHALLCDLLDDDHPAISDGVRLWLMLQKETQKWDEDPAFVDAISSILNGSPEVLGTRVLAFSATYTAPYAGLKAAGNGFTIERCFFREGGEEISEGASVKVGERIRAEYRIWNQENRSFVRLSAGHEASLSPVQQLSGYMGYGVIRPFRDGARLSFSPYGYRDVKAERTDFFFDAYPEESSVISEEFFVQIAGRFTAPVVTIESLYAPHYRANAAFTAPLVARP